MAIDDKFTVREYEAKSYSFQFAKGYNWAIYTVNDHTGEFTIQSDWGDYTYRWNVEHLGPRDNKSTLHEFLAHAEPHYIVNKFGQNKHHTFRKQFDDAATKIDLFNSLCERRREKEISKEDAREAWDEINETWDIYIDQHSDPTAKSIMLWENLPESVSKLFEDFHEWMVYEESREWTFCEKKLVPFFLKFLRSNSV
jgi:hypothetical protein